MCAAVSSWGALRINRSRCMQGDIDASAEAGFAASSSAEDSTRFLRVEGSWISSTSPHCCASEAAIKFPSYR